jgi:tRNA-uridine 2-sulfurtransferase
MKSKRVLLAMSGGVDSSVSAILLKEQGYEIIGITFRVYSSQNQRVNPLEKSINDASILADILKIPYYIIDVQKEFEQKIISNFVSEYYSGQTPNPCALCNPEIKWKNLLDIANELDCIYIATGHYAISNKENDRYFITKGLDEIKDQSYFLWRLNQEQIKRTIFPLGHFNKVDIKKIARDRGLKILAEKRESYNICFIPEGGYRSFLSNYSVDFEKERIGQFISESNEILGFHQGIENYTIGQKIILESRIDDAYYVSRILPEENKILIEQKSRLMLKELIVNKLNLSKYDILPEDIKITAKLRYKDSAVGCNISIFGDLAKVSLDEPVFAICPGQSIVFYEGNDLIGGGVILKT